MKTQKEIRSSFWETFPEFEEQARKAGTFSKGQNAQNATTRCCFVQFVDGLNRDGVISDSLANRATL